MRSSRGWDRHIVSQANNRDSRVRWRAVRQAAMEALEDRRLYHAGDLDNTFSGDGTATVTPGGVLVVASMDTRGGRTVVIGGNNEIAPGNVIGNANIVAYNNSGNLDTTFSGDGIRPIPRLQDPTDIFIQPDGKILAVGTVDGVAGVARLLKNGGADTSFSGDGFMPVPQMETITGVRLTSTGKIVLSGFHNTNGTEHLAAARLNVNGSLDNSFSGDGFVTLNIDGHANALAVQSDDKIVLVGSTPDFSTGDDIVVARLTTSGALDTSFGSAGWTTYNEGSDSVGSAVDLTPAGRILVGAVFQHNVIGALRLTKAGAFDAVVEDPGRLEGSVAVVHNIRSSFDGNQFYLFADAYNGYPVRSIVARYDSDLTPDHTFGDNGRIDSNGEGHGDLEADGKIITAGNPTQLDDMGGTVTNAHLVQARRRIPTIDPNDRIQLQENIIVEGTNGDDKITVTRNVAAGTITVKMNNVTKTFGDAALFEIRIEGGKGNDTIDIRGTHLTGDLFGGEGNDTIYGDTQADHIYGGEGNDNTVAGAGDDLVFGNAGDDVINGGDGNDELYGSAGRDRVYGYAGDDQLCGADRQIVVDHVADYLDGGVGTDTGIIVEDVDATNSVELRG